jgi:hypothetical protein
MAHRLLALFCSLSALSLSSCFTDPPICSPIGKRIRDQSVRGVIYGDVGAKAEVKSCPGIRLPLVFVGTEPTDYQRLKLISQRRHSAVSFSGLGDGYIVKDGAPDRYSLLLVALTDIREAPNTAKNRNVGISGHGS